MLAADPIVILPLFILSLIVVVIGVKSGLKRAIIAAVIGVFALFALCVAWLIVYYANGGH